MQRRRPSEIRHRNAESKVRSPDTDGSKIRPVARSLASRNLAPTLVGYGDDAAVRSVRRIRPADEIASLEPVDMRYDFSGAIGWRGRNFVHRQTPFRRGERAAQAGTRWQSVLWPIRVCLTHFSIFR